MYVSVTQTNADTCQTIPGPSSDYISPDLTMRSSLRFYKWMVTIAPLPPLTPPFIFHLYPSQSPSPLVLQWCRPLLLDCDQLATHWTDPNSVCDCI